MGIVALALFAATTQTSMKAPGKLLWSDEFLKDGRPNPEIWGYDTGNVANNEKQFYPVDRPENARVEGGKLIIEARKDGFEGHEITSARLVTRGKKEIQYGRIEVRAKVPPGRGTWPAIWMLGTNIKEVGWPACGEIDMMEFVGYDADRLHFNIHTKAFNHVMKTNKGTSIDAPNASRDFHTYTLDWSATRMDWYLDGKRVFAYQKPAGATADEWPFDAPQYLLLNLAIGGDWGGAKGIDDAIFPSRFEVDYVRVYAPN